MAIMTHDFLFHICLHDVIFSHSGTAVCDDARGQPDVAKGIFPAMLSTCTQQNQNKIQGLGQQS